MFKELKISPAERSLRVLLLKLIATFFIFALIFEMIVFPNDPKRLLSWIYIITDLTLPLAYFLFRRKWITDDKALIIQSLAISVSQCSDMIYRIVNTRADTDMIMIASVLIMIVPLFVAGLTTWRLLPFILAGVTLILYGLTMYVTKSHVLQGLYPFMALLVVGIVITQYLIMNAWRKADSSRLQAIEENAIISRFLNLNPQEVHLIAQGKMTRKKATELQQRMEDAASTALINRVKNVIQTEEVIKQVIRKAHPNLTAHDLQLCCHIADGLTIAEIAQLAPRAISSVTAHRSRLRTKLRLEEGRNLKDYILMLVNENVK